MPASADGRVVAPFIATAFAQNDAEADGLADRSFPRARPATSHAVNPLERVNGESQRRTDAVGILPNAAAIRRLVGAIRLEPNDEAAVPPARSMKLAPIAAVSDDPIVSIAHLER